MGPFEDAGRIEGPDAFEGARAERDVGAFRKNEQNEKARTARTSGLDCRCLVVDRGKLHGDRPAADPAGTPGRDVLLGVPIIVAALRAGP